MMFEIGVPKPLLSVLALLSGAVIALAVGWARGRKAGISAAVLARVTVLLTLCAAFFSHLCYCLVCVAEVAYTQPLVYWLTFWQNGQMFYGGLLGAFLALALGGGRDRLRLMDAYAPSCALALVAARVAEGLSGQGYGEYWYGEGTFFCRFPFMAYDPYYESWAWALFMAGAAISLLLIAVVLVFMIAIGIVSARMERREEDER